MARCSVPECEGIRQTDPAFREALWARYFMAAPRPRTPSELRYSDRRLRAAQYGLNHKTVAKWRKRAFVNDVPMGPKTPRSTVLSPEEEAIVVAFRKHTLLPLDDCLYALQATIPNTDSPAGLGDIFQAFPECILKTDARLLSRNDD